MARFNARRGIDYALIRKYMKRSSSSSDEPKPKRARSAYIFFCQEERPKLKEKLEGNDEHVPPVEMMAMLAKRWKDADEATKARFQRLADEDKVRYKKEQKALEKPKRVRAAYNFFVAHERPLLADKLEHQEIFGEIGRKWKALDDEGKQKWIEMENEDKERYMSEKAEWDKTHNKNGSKKISSKEQVDNENSKQNVVEQG